MLARGRCGNRTRVAVVERLRAASRWRCGRQGRRRRDRARRLRQFREESTANYRDPEEGLQAWRFYLQTMIDMKLMLLAAQEQRLDQTVEFVRQWERERRKKLVDEYAVRTILADVDLAVDGMRQEFATSKWNRMLRLAHIRTASAANAQKAMRDLEQGRTLPRWPAGVLSRRQPPMAG